MSHSISRREFIRRGSTLAAAVGIVGPLAACSGGSSSESGPSNATINVQLKWLKNAESAGFWIADDAGYYRDQTLTPNFIAGGPNIATTTPIVAGGRADIAEEQLLTVVDAISQGEDFVVIGTVFQTNPLGILSLPKAPVLTARDLVGKRVGMQQGAKEQVDALLKVNGLETNYEVVPVGFDPAPLVEGACDAYTCFVTNQAVALEQKGVAHIATTFGAMGLPSYSDVLFAKRSWLNQNRDAVVRWLRGSIKGWERNVQDPALGARLSVQKYGLSLGLQQDQQELQNKMQVSLIQSDLTREKGLLYVSKEELAGPIYKGFEAAGRANLPSPDQVIDTSFLAEAYGGKKSLL